MLFDYVKANRDKTLFWGVIMIAVGLIFGISYSVVESYIYKVFSYILLYGIFPIGLFSCVYGYYIKFYNNPKLLLLKSIAFTVIFDICFYFGMVGEFKNYNSIIMLIVVTVGTYFLKKVK